MMRKFLTLVTPMMVLATCNLLAGPARKEAATANNNVVLVLEPTPCGGVEVVVLYVEKIDIVDQYNSIGNLASPSNLFISISGKSFQPTFPAEAATDASMRAALVDLPTINPDNAPRKVAIVYRTTAANTIADAAGFGAPRKFPSKAHATAGFKGNPQNPNRTWGLATETSLISPAAG